MFAIQKKIAKAVVILVAVFLLPLISLSAEKEIKIGYLFSSENSIALHFNVPVTKEMIEVIKQQEGVDFVATSAMGRYELHIGVGKMFSREEVIDNIVKTLEKKIFIGKPVKAYHMK